MTLSQEDRLKALQASRGVKRKVDLSSLTPTERKRAQSKSRNYAYQEVVHAHKGEYDDAYYGWLEAFVEQKKREGSI